MEKIVLLTKWFSYAKQEQQVQIQIIRGMLSRKIRGLALIAAD